MKINIIVFLVAILAIENSAADEVAFDGVMKQCCEAGESHADTLTNCKGFNPPNVTAELISSCIYSAEICCQSKVRLEKCKGGVLAAKDGLDCHKANNETGNDFYKNCCESCKIGLVFGTMSKNCTLTHQYTSPFDDALVYCCNEIKSDDSVVLTDEMDLCSEFGNICSQICETTGDQQIVCKCEPGYTLMDDKKTCKKIANETNETNETIGDNENCASGYLLNENTGECEDIDECEGSDIICDLNTQVCVNSKGSYKCLNINQVSNPIPTCPNGYKFDLDTKQCEDINECELELGKVSCGSNRMCINSPGGYNCLDVKNSSNKKNNDVLIAPTKKKLTCSKGYKQQFNKCIDIDECATDRNACASNQNCNNTPGSFECECKSGFTLDKALNACIDINECQINNHDCLESQRCDNTIGSYTCIRLQSCGTGYTLNAETGFCDDDDECALSRHNCKPPYECRNTKGSFRCEKPRYTTTPSPAATTARTTVRATVRTTTTPRPYTHTATYTHTPYTYTPSYRPMSMTSVNPRLAQYDTQLGPCGVGFQRNAQGACVDIDECLSPNVCRRNQRCVNTNGSYKCLNLLSCSGGFTSNDEGTQCIDIDECATGVANCGPDEICRNKPGGYTCSCPTGYQLNAQRRCEDINECDFYKGQVCPGNSECVNSAGSYRCDCKEGFKRQVNDDKVCVDVDECTEIPGLCAQRCINYWGSFRCACETGFHLSENNRTCEDIDECEVHKKSNLCMGFCENTHGSYQCACPPGYKLGSDGRSCQDIDECETENVCRGRNEICTNIKGSHRCTRKNCPADYINDPEYKNRCKRISLTCEHGDIECFKRPTTYTYHFITLVSNLSLPPNGRALFTYKGPTWFENIDFDFKLLYAQAPQTIQPANERFFQMEKINNQARLSLMQTLDGPQDIELEMSMTVFQNGQPGGTNVAKIFIFVSEYAY